jgi:hypothetical protein
VATTTRAPGGRFASAYDTLDLYGIVRDVALAASAEEPTSVSEAVWDAAREPAGHPGTPSARAICARLSDAEGRPFPWRELLELVFDESRDPEHVHALRARVEEDDALDEGHVYYALRRAARELGVKTLAPDGYARVRAQLIERARRRRRREAGHLTPVHELLLRLLPTVGQIERVAGDWPRALEFAELDPRPELGARIPERGTPIAEVLDRFADETGGSLCRPRQLLEYARNRGIVMAARARDSSWDDYLAEVKALHEARGATTHGLPPRGVYPDYPGRGEGSSRRPATEAAELLDARAPGRGGQALLRRSDHRAEPLADWLPGLVGGTRRRAGPERVREARRLEGRLRHGPRPPACAADRTAGQAGGPR